MKPRARLYSWQLYTHQNYGDALLAEAIRYLFHSFGDGAYFRFEDGADSRYELGPKIIEYANTFDAGVIAGGGLIIPRNENLSGWAFKSSVSNARKLKRTIVFAVGYNLYRRHQELPPIFKEHFEAVIENSPFVGLRNHASVEKVREIVDRKYHDRIVFQPCPTTFIRRLVEGFDPVAHPTPSKRVALQITTFGSELNGEQMSAEVLDACRKLKLRGYVIDLVSFFARFDAPIVDYLRNNGFDDFTFTELNTEGRDMLIGPQLFSNVPITVCSRGHGAMVPFGAGSTIVPIDTAPKVQYFAEECNISDRLLDPHSPTLGNDIVNQVEQIQSSYEAEQRRLDMTRTRFYETTLDNLGRIYLALTGETADDRRCVPLSEFEVFLSSCLHRKCVKLEGVTRGQGAQT